RLVRNCAVGRRVSLKRGAETGRGTLGRRSAAITAESVQQQIEKGARATISFDALRVGHARCNRYGMIFVTNERAYDALDDRRSRQGRRGRSSAVALGRPP